MKQLAFSGEQSELNDLQNWLLKLHGDEACPDLHPDIHNIKHLLAIKSQNEELEKNIVEEIKLKTSRIQSINSKTKELKTLLKSESVSLSPETWKQIDSIAGLAAKMNIEEPDLTNLLLAICNMKNETIQNKEQRIMNCFVLSSYSRRNLKIKKSNDNIKSQLDDLEEVVAIQESNKVKIEEKLKYYNVKSTEYDQRIKLNKDRLKAINFDSSLMHSSLVERSKVIGVLEEKLKIAKEKLKNYKKLPPNESLTNLKIKEKEDELGLLENKFASLIEMWEKS